MAKILIVGSQKNHDQEEFRALCRDIGRALVLRGHTIVAAGCGDADAETWVLDGANASGGAKHMKVIPYAPAIVGAENLLLSTDLEQRWPRLQFLSPLQTKGGWAVGQAVALIKSDAALLVGGGILTSGVGSLASELEIPFYAVSKLGGAAEQIADAEEAKLRLMRMPRDLIDVIPGSRECGERVVKAVEFVITHRVSKKEAWGAARALIAEVGLLSLFMAYLYHDKLTANEPRIILTTCLGAMLGVVLAFLIGSALRDERISYVRVLRQLALAIMLGVLYGLFSFEIGSFYNAQINTFSQSQVEELANRMALLGVGVGALLGPASRIAIQNLRRTAELD